MCACWFTSFCTLTTSCFSRPARSLEHTVPFAQCTATRSFSHTSTHTHTHVINYLPVCYPGLPYPRRHASPLSEGRLCCRWWISSGIMEAVKVYLFGGPSLVAKRATMTEAHPSGPNYRPSLSARLAPWQSSACVCVCLAAEPARVHCLRWDERQQLQ